MATPQKPEPPGHNMHLTIIVNGTPFEVPKKEVLSYDEVVTLAFPSYPSNPQNTYSVTYTRGHGDKPEGTLSPGGSVKAKDGMVFKVSQTGAS